MSKKKQKIQGIFFWRAYIAQGEVPIYNQFLFNVVFRSRRIPLVSSREVFASFPEIGFLKLRYQPHIRGMLKYL